MKIGNRKSEIENRPGFTLVELLVVISVIGILAGIGLAVLPGIKRQQYLKIARVEMETVQTALENYKAKYGAYPPGNRCSAAPNYDPAMFSQLFYELSGTTPAVVGGNSYFVTLDGSVQILVNDVKTAYGVGGFVNCTRGGGEDGVVARNFLVNLNPNRYNLSITNNGIRTAQLISSVGGPDDDYKPLGASGLNPFRYLYPGINNPGSYDLWIDLSISGKTNRVSNWNRQVQILN